MVTSAWISRAIHAVAALGLADALDTEPRSAREIASFCGARSTHVYRLLRALATLGVFLEDPQGLFRHTPLSRLLRRDEPGSLHAAVLMISGGEQEESWAKLPHAVQVGRSGFSLRFGTGVWEYYRNHAEQARLFNRAMTELSAIVNAAVVAAYDFARYARIVDVGGGQGGLLAAALEASPNALGVLYDQPSVVEEARTCLAARGLAQRSACIAGDFFEYIPEGGDLYLLKWVIRDWADDPALSILGNIRRAICQFGRLILIESVVDGSPAASLSDLNAMVVYDGLERTEAEYRALLREAGFELARIIPTGSLVQLLEAAPVA